uniref:Uncharacterized protein n=1 Tax=Oryza nivara TaxID=4536 RepID=A0A0E0FWD1_ORYNI
MPLSNNPLSFAHGCPHRRRRPEREGGDIIRSQREAHTTAQVSAVEENERLDLDLDDLDEAVGELFLDFFLLLFLGGFGTQLGEAALPVGLSQPIKIITMSKMGLQNF